MEDNRIQNQIAIYMTNKKLCEFTDKLKPAPIEYYAHMWRPVLASQRIPCLPRSCWVLWAAYPPMIGISKRLLLIPVLHPKFSVRNPSEPLATCILTMRMSLKSSGNIAAAELSIRQPKSWTCAFLSMASRETRAAKKTAIRLFCEEGSLWNML